MEDTSFHGSDFNKRILICLKVVSLRCLLFPDKNFEHSSDRIIIIRIVI